MTEENGLFQMRKNFSIVSAPWASLMLTEVEFAIGTATCFGGSLNLESTPKVGAHHVPSRGVASSGAEVKCRKNSKVLWKINSFIRISNHLVFLLTPHTPKFIVFILHITAFKFRRRRREYGHFHLFGLFIKGAAMNMWHQMNTWQSKQGEPAVAFVIGITNSHHPSSSYHIHTTQESRGVSSECICLRRISQRQCLHYLLKKETLLAFSYKKW